MRSDTFMRSVIYLICVSSMAALLAGCLHQRYVRSSDSCINNLRQIDGAKQQWMVEQNKTINDVPTWDDIRDYVGRSGTTGPVLTCPAGGTYTIGRLNASPTCSIGGPGHTLP